MMNSREALIQRRRQLQVQLRHDEESAPVADLIAALEAAGDDYRLIWAEESAAHPDLALLARAPLRSSRIDWEGMRDVRAFAAADEEAAADAMVAALNMLAQGSLKLTVTWGNGRTPSLILQRATAEAHMPLIADADFEVWIFDPAQDWVIESKRREGVCAGRLPA